MRSPSFLQKDNVPRSSRSTRPVRGLEVPLLLAAVGAGAAAMYFLDPARGRLRRHLVRDKVVHAAHASGDLAARTGRDVRNRARGAGSMVRRQLTRDRADDIVLSERVRSQLGHVVSQPRSIDVTADQGTVTLSGDAPAREADGLIARVARVRGVRTVEDNLERRS